MTAKRKPGRPSKHTDLDMAKVKLLVDRGLTDAEMAMVLGVAESTWHLWKQQYPEFSESLNDWKYEADHKVERSLYERATGFHCKEVVTASIGGHITDVQEVDKYYPPDTTAAIFWLKNRKRKEWRDRQDHELSGPDGAPIATTNTTLSKDELVAVMKKRGLPVTIFDGDGGDDG